MPLMPALRSRTPSSSWRVRCARPAPYSTTATSSRRSSASAARISTGRPRITPGAPLMAIVPPERLRVDANFKEVQLKHMRIGQPASLTADLYGGRVEFHGRVEGLGLGTGAAFALLPAQNATGNWIKVVQRVPV